MEISSEEENTHEKDTLLNLDSDSELEKAFSKFFPSQNYLFLSVIKFF